MSLVDRHDFYAALLIIQILSRAIFVDRRKIRFVRFSYLKVFSKFVLIGILW